MTSAYSINRSLNTGNEMIHRAILLVIAAFFLYANLASAEPGPKNRDGSPAESWHVIPAGAKPSYMGIHGGTMPVSLLVSVDGSSLLSFIGRTGNDFMEALRNAHVRLPSLGNSTMAPARAQTTNIFAGNATVSMPVFAVPGSMPGRMDVVSRLVPFGLSQKPLSIEGTVEKPGSFPHARTVRPFRIPDYFQPRLRRNQDR